MSEFENNGVVGLCGVNNVNFIRWSTRDQLKAKLCFNRSGGGFYRRARQSCDDV